MVIIAHHHQVAGEWWEGLSFVLHSGNVLSFSMLAFCCGGIKSRKSVMIAEIESLTSDAKIVTFACLLWVHHVHYWLQAKHSPSHILGVVHGSVPRSTIITQGRQAIKSPVGDIGAQFFNACHTQTHRNWHISAQNVKNMLKFTRITVSLPAYAVWRHNCAQKFHLSCILQIPNVFWAHVLGFFFSFDMTLNQVFSHKRQSEYWKMADWSSWMTFTSEYRLCTNFVI